MGSSRNWRSQNWLVSFWFPHQKVGITKDTHASRQIVKLEEPKHPSSQPPSGTDQTKWAFLMEFRFGRYSRGNQKEANHFRGPIPILSTALKFSTRFEARMRVCAASTEGPVGRMRVTEEAGPDIQDPTKCLDLLVTPPKMVFEAFWFPPSKNCI